MYKVTNKFHSTEAKTTLSEDDYCLAGYETGQWASKEQASINRRAKRLDDKLCGMKDCSCSGMYRWSKTKDDNKLNTLLKAKNLLLDACKEAVKLQCFYADEITQEEHNIYEKLSNAIKLTERI